MAWYTRKRPQDCVCHSILKELNKMGADLDALNAEVARNSALIQKAIVKIDALSAAGAATPADLQAVTAILKGSDDSLEPKVQ